MDQETLEGDYAEAYQRYYKYWQDNAPTESKPFFPSYQTPLSIQSGWQGLLEKNMKEFSCCKGHQFNSEECKEEWKNRPICPFCWPNGFLNVKEIDGIDKK